MFLHVWLFVRTMQTASDPGQAGRAKLWCCYARNCCPTLNPVQVRDVPVVGVTCLSAARAPLLRSRLFDICILDEATQVTLPASLSPILRSRTFVLVGDHLQLPPLVKSRKAQVCFKFQWAGCALFCISDG